MNKENFFLLLIILLLFISGTVFSIDIEGVQIAAGKAVLLNAEPVEDSPAPASVSSIFGISVPMKINNTLYFEPGLRFFNHWVVLDSDNKPVLAAIETKDRISVLDCELRPEIGALFGITDQISLGVTGAPVFTFRFPIKAYDDAEDSDQKTTVRDYYFSSIRFLGVYAGGFLTWDFTDDYSLKLKIGTNLPIYHLWDGEDIDFYDQLLIEPEIGIVFRF